MRRPLFAVEELMWLNRSPMLRGGADLRPALDRERADVVAVLGELGLLKLVFYRLGQALDMTRC